MSKILRLFKKTPQLFVLFCVATVIGQIILLAVLKSKRLLTDEKVNRVLAVVYGIDDYPLVSPRLDQVDVEIESPALNDIEAQRLLTQLDLTLRENAIDKGNASLNFLQARLTTNRERFMDIKESFDEEVKQKEKATLNEGLRQLQRSLQSLPPKQAKDTLQRFVEDKEMSDVVHMLRAMPPDKRKRILGEFKTGEDQDLLQDILGEMLMGDVRLIENAQKRMNQEFNAKRN